MKSDDDLKKDVLVRLELDPALDVAGLGICVKNGVVTLEGILHDVAEQAAVERAVKRVPGVKGVVDRVRLESAESAASRDTDVAAEVADALQWLTTVPPEAVAASIQDGWVTLKGVVDSRHLREMIEEVVRHLPEVKGVNNLVRIAASARNANEFTCAA